MKVTDETVPEEDLEEAEDAAVVEKRPRRKQPDAYHCDMPCSLKVDTTKESLYPFYAKGGVILLIYDNNEVLGYVHQFHLIHLKSVEDNQ